MSRLRFGIKILKKIFSTPSSLYQVLNPPAEDGRFGQSYVEAKYGLTRLKTVNALDVVSAFDEKIDHYSYLPGTSLVVDIALLKALCRDRPNCSYLEIGTWRGESIANVSTVAETCVSVTLGEKEMRALGMSDKAMDLHSFYIEEDMNIREVHADSTKFDFDSLNQKFDVIFIDGDHSKPGVESDSRKMFDMLKDDKSVIVWHDYGWDTERIRYNTLAGILDGSPSWAHPHIYHVNGTKCALFTKEKVATFDAARYDLPRVNFNHTIAATKIN